MSDAISSRLASYQRTLDRQVLDETGALLDAGAALLAAASGPGGPSRPPLGAIAAVGLLHSHRVRDRDDDDSRAALAMFAFVHQADPRAVPAEARRYRRLISNATSGRAPDLADCLAAEQAVLQSRWNVTGEASLCQVMVGLARRAAEITPPGHPFLGVHLSNLGASLGRLYQLSHDPGTLGPAIQASQEALAVLPHGHLVRLRTQSNLAGLLRARSGYAGSRADLDEAVRLCRPAAVADQAAAGPELAMHKANLSVVLHARYAHTGTAADLEAAVAAARAAVAARGPARQVPARHWAALSIALLARFERYRCGEDVTAAIQAGRSAVGALSQAGAGDPDRPAARMSSPPSGASATGWLPGSPITSTSAWPASRTVTRAWPPGRRPPPCTRPRGSSATGASIRWPGHRSCTPARDRPGAPQASFAATDAALRSRRPSAPARTCW